MFSCYLKRRRIGAYLDGGLPDGEAHRIATHLGACPGCREEARGLGRVRGLLRSAVAASEPDWIGFWPGIVRGIEAGSAAPDRARSLRRAERRRIVVAGAVAVWLLAITIWQAGDSPTVFGRASTVAGATTEYPDGSVMVYTPPEDDMTVIWVFGSDSRSGPSAI